MKKTIILTMIIYAILLTGRAQAALFFEDFESGLSNWTGKDQGAHHGEIVTDPFNSENHVLHFTGLNGGGDIFTINTFSSSNSQFVLSFDYLGRLSQDSGGYIGYSYSFPGDHTWLAGTKNEPNRIELPDTGNWEHVEIPFQANGEIHLMLEEYQGSDRRVGNAYFDNIKLSAVPLPSAIWLLGAGLGLLGMSRKSKAS